MWGRVLLVVFLLDSLEFGGISGLPPSTTTAPAIFDGSNQLRAGRGMNIFSRFGYLSISMRVVPRNDSNTNWLFREPTVDIFQNLDSLQIQTKPNTSKRLDGDFHMEFCDNIRQLLQAYFRDFTFEQFERPWRAFSGSWMSKQIARNMGINASFVESDYCYVLVRLSRFRDSVRLATLPNERMQLMKDVADEVDSVHVGNVSSVLQFIRKFGSHYITSYVTGNSLYQVFVYKRSIYTNIKEMLKSRGVTEFTSFELSNYFSPWFADHVGQIRVASGNQTVERWANAKLRVNYFIFSYPSLLKLHTDTSLLKIINELLQNEALLQIDLRTLSSAFRDPLKRAWFEEVLDNYIRLWDVNM